MRCSECDKELNEGAENELGGPLCHSCAQSSVDAAYERGLCDADIGEKVIKFLEKEVGHYPLTAADIVARPNLKILEDALHV